MFDAKLSGKLADGEKYLKSVLLPALGSSPDRFNLIGVIEWRSEPQHPFEEKYGAGQGGIDLRKLFEQGLGTAGLSSSSHRSKPISLAAPRSAHTTAPEWAAAIRHRRAPGR